MVDHEECETVRIPLCYNPRYATTPVIPCGPDLLCHNPRCHYREERRCTPHKRKECVSRLSYRTTRQSRHRKLHFLPTFTVKPHITRKCQCRPRVGLLNHILRIIEHIPYLFRTCVTASSSWVVVYVVVSGYLGPTEG